MKMHRILSVVLILALSLLASCVREDAQQMGTSNYTSDNNTSSGSVAIGDGSPSVTQDGEDLYVEGQFEVDGEAQLDGALDANSTSDFAGMATFNAGITGVQDIESVMFPTVVSTAITYTAAAGGTGVVATIGAGEVWLVHAVLVDVTTNFDATGDDATLTVGDGNDADGFIVLADAELQAADTEGTGFQAGWQGMAAATQGVYLDGNWNGFVYAPSSAETIDYAIDETSGETLTAGAATIYVIYTRIQ